MIASLTGVVKLTSLGSIVLDVNGVGYQVQVTPALALSVQAGNQLSVFTSLIVREDAFTLYGFETEDELAKFDLLRSVTGVGPKSALSVIHQLGVERLVTAIANDDDGAFKSVSGIGPKTAKLIIVTLAGKLGSTKTGNRVANSNVIAALTGLGYQAKAAELAVSQSGTGAESDEELLRAALQKLAK